MVWVDRVVGDSVVSNEKGPASPVTVVLVASMEDVGVKEESVPGLHLDLNQRKHLQGVGRGGKE